LTRIIHRTCFVTSVALLLLFSIAAGASTQKKDKKTKRVDEAIVQSKRAAETFDRVMKSVDPTAFQKVFDQAKVVGVVQIDQGGTLLTALIGGKGLFCLRDAAGWGPPVFFYIGGGSLGPQFGTKSSSIILLFMNDNAASWLSEKSVVLQGEKKIIPGPTTEAPDPAVNIYGYIVTEGKSIGFAHKKLAILPDNDLNQAIYGLKAHEVLSKNDFKDQPGIPEEISSFRKLLGQASPIK